MKIKYLGLVLLAVVLFFAYQPLINNFKVLLLISEEFPQVPIKPLQLLTSEPFHKEIQFDSPYGKIQNDLFIPKGGVEKPALILAMAVKTAPKDRPIILGFAETMSRLGYVVMWPRLKILDEGISTYEEPETLVKAFNYLQILEGVDKNRISFVGFSAGSSVAFVAATYPAIRERVRSLVFFGGYYDIFDYLESLVTKQSVFQNNIIEWQPAEGAVSHTTEVLNEKNASGILKALRGESAEQFRVALRGAPATESNSLKKISPVEHISNFQARIFILHDKNDPYVPYFESLKLNEALPQNISKTLTVVNLFEHVQPQKGFSFEIISEFVKLYGFLYQAISYL